MSDDQGLTDAVTEEVTNQVGVADMLGEGGLEDKLDGNEIGAAVGRQFGERVGRKMGAAVGREVHEAIAEGVEEGRSLSELRSDVTAAVRTGVNDAIDDLGGRSAVESLAGSVGDGRLGKLLEGEEPAEEGETGEDEEGETEEDEEPTEDEGETETEDAGEEGTGPADEEAADGAEAEDSETEGETEAESGAEGDSEPSAEDLADLRRETLEDFLGVMSYEDLQSIAKEIDVKANLSREEMTDEIIETVTGEDDGGDEAEATNEDQAEASE